MSMIISADGTETEFLPSDDTYSLKEMQSAVDGYVQFVFLRENKMLIANEDAVMKRLAINEKATEIAGVEIRGDVLICDKSLIK